MEEKSRAARETWATEANRLNVLDLFCGCGGLSYGFEKAGYKIVAGVDSWKDALVTFEKNHQSSKGILLDLSDFDPKDIENAIDQPIDIVIGGPPCQGFSISGKRNPDDPRNKLYQGFVKTVAFFRPRAFVLENVPNLVSMNHGAIKDAIIKEFGELGYTVKFKIVVASDYGVPQNRRRVIFVGLRNQEFVFPEVDCTQHVTCREALSDLPEKTLADGEAYPTDAVSDYQSLMRADSAGVFNHEATKHTAQTVRIISLVPDGGNYKNLPTELQNTRKVNIAWTRMRSDKPSMTIDTGHNHHFHYQYNRVPAARESARLQSFPDKFVFYGGKTSQLKQIGNAVPPLLAEYIAKSLRSQL